MVEHKKNKGSSFGFLRVLVSWRWMSVFLAFGGVAFAAGIQVIKEVPSTFVYPTGGFLPFDIHRATQTMLSLMLPGASFNDPRGVACALLKVDHDPKAPLNDVVVTCIGVNSGAGEIIYNVGLRDIRRFGSTGRGDKQFSFPNGAAIHPNGDVAIADTGNDRIALLKHDGLRMKWVAGVGKKGTQAGEFNAPMGVAYDSHGNLYVADTGNNRIQVRDAQGRFRVLRTPALQGPSGIAVIDSKEAWTFYQQGPYANRLAVIDRQGQRLQTLDLQGDPLAQISAEKMPDGPVKMWGCAFDYYGNLVVTDFEKSVLRKFDKDLRYLVTFGSMGEDDHQFFQPRGIAIHHQFGQVLVSEKNCVQYFWNGADAVSVKAEQEAQKIRIAFFLTERAIVGADIKTEGGALLKNLATNQDMEQGAQELAWVPEADIPKGDYVLKLRVMATYSSRDRIAKEISLPVRYSK